MGEVEKIKALLPEDERLCQLAEEAIELAQAALKVRRVLTGMNPTPGKYADAMLNMLGECGDVLNAMEVLITPTESECVTDSRLRKRKRWVERLEKRDSNGE